jgi:3-methyladenine DNA glycosylase AlkD
MEILQEIRSKLFEMRDVKYQQFNSSLIPNVNSEFVIGVRTPELRKYASELAKRDDIGEFLAVLPHEYFEENQLHAFIIEKTKDYDKCLAQVEEFLPFIDNWATCDQCAPKVLVKNPERLISSVKQWISSDKPYTIRYGIGMLMRVYLDDRFSPEYPELVAAVESQEYYVNMMRAWYFATALAKQYEAVIGYFEDARLDEWTHNKSIQKACESYRVSDERKAYLRTLKRKG